MAGGIVTEWLEFDVEGIPTPQGSKRAYVRNGRANILEVAGESLKAWRQDVTTAALYARKHQEFDTIDGVVEIEVYFRLPRPKSRPHDTWHATRPDLDKLLRAVLDALTNAQVFTDDSRVADVKATKIYTTSDRAPGATIAVREKVPWE